MAKYLLKLENQKITNSFLLEEGSVNLGRDETNHIRFERPEISRKHARITLNKDQVNVVDLGSSYGVWINGEKYDYSHPLEIGIKFKICDAFDLCISDSPHRIEKLSKASFATQTLADGMADFEFSNIPKIPLAPTDGEDTDLPEPIVKEEIPSHFKDRADELDQSNALTSATAALKQDKPVLHLDPKEEEKLFPRAHAEELAELNALLNPMIEEDDDLDSTNQPSEDGVKEEEDLSLPFKHSTPHANEPSKALAELLAPDEEILPSATLKYEINPITLNQGLGDLELPKLDTPNSQKLEYLDYLKALGNKATEEKSEGHIKTALSSLAPSDFSNSLKDITQSTQSQIQESVYLSSSKGNPTVDHSVPQIDNLPTQQLQLDALSQISTGNHEQIKEELSQANLALTQSQERVTQVELDLEKIKLELAQAQLELEKLRIDQKNKATHFELRSEENQQLQQLLAFSQQVFTQRFTYYAHELQELSQAFPAQSIAWRHYLGVNVQLKQDIHLLNQAFYQDKNAQQEISLKQAIQYFIEKSQKICPNDFKLKLEADLDESQVSEEHFVVKESLVEELYRLLYFYISHQHKALSIVIRGDQSKRFTIELTPPLPSLSELSHPNMDFDESLQDLLMLQRYLLKQY